MDNQSNDIQITTPTAEVKSSKQRWLLFTIAPIVVLAAAYFGWSAIGPSLTPEPLAFPDLPEYFQPRHRVSRVKPGPVDGRGKVYVEGRGFILPKDAPPPGNTTEAWFDEHFTHYIERGAFFWASPRVVYPSDGKLVIGTKVIVGATIDDDFSLVCVRTRDSRLINMFVTSDRLRHRSEGPPPPDDD